MNPITFTFPTADVFLPQGGTLDENLARVTHLAIGAHQDDLEFMAFHGICQCFHANDKWFGGVTCTDGAGSSRTGPYATKTDEEMCSLRRIEQQQAAQVGRYAAMIQLDQPSRTVKAPDSSTLINDLRQIIQRVPPGVVYTHNPADKHETHIAVLAGVLGAIWELPPENRPSRLLGCEVWRDLDWLHDAEKVALDVSGFDSLAASLNGIFNSQIAGGKRYDLAVIGRRRANATFFNSHASDTADMISFAMDLTPLISAPESNPVAFVEEKIQAFQNEVTKNLRHLLRRK